MTSIYKAQTTGGGGRLEKVHGRGRLERMAQCEADFLRYQGRNRTDPDAHTSTLLGPNQTAQQNWRADAALLTIAHQTLFAANNCAPLHTLHHAAKHTQTAPPNFKTINTNIQKPFVVTKNATQSTLAILSGTANPQIDLFDALATAKAAHADTPLPPAIESHTFAGARALDFEFSPSDPTLAILLTTDSLQVLRIQTPDQGCTLTTTSASDINVTCACWSASGSRVWYGDESGQLLLRQFDRDKFCAAQPIPVAVPDSCSELKLQSIHRLSDRWLLLGYNHPTDEFFEPNILVLDADAAIAGASTAPHECASTLFPLPRAASESDEGRLIRRIHVAPIPEWRMATVCSTDSDGVLSIGSRKPKDQEWQRWALPDEEGPPSVPMVDGGDDGIDSEQFVIGLAMDFYNEERLVLVAGEEAFPPSPVVWAFTSHGGLIGWTILHKKAKADGPNTTYEFMHELKTLDGNGESTADPESAKPQVGAMQFGLASPATASLSETMIACQSPAAESAFTFDTLAVAVSESKLAVSQAPLDKTPDFAFGSSASAAESKPASFQAPRDKTPAFACGSSAPAAESKPASFQAPIGKTPAFAFGSSAPAAESKPATFQAPIGKTPAFAFGSSAPAAESRPASIQAPADKGPAIAFGSLTPAAAAPESETASLQAHADKTAAIAFGSFAPAAASPQSKPASFQAPIKGSSLPLGNLATTASVAESTPSSASMPAKHSAQSAAALLAASTNKSSMSEVVDDTQSCLNNESLLLLSCAKAWSESQTGGMGVSIVTAMEQILVRMSQLEGASQKISEALESCPAAPGRVSDLDEAEQRIIAAAKLLDSNRARLRGVAASVEAWESRTERTLTSPQLGTCDYFTSAHFINIFTEQVNHIQQQKLVLDTNVLLAQLEAAAIADEPHLQAAQAVYAAVEWLSEPLKAMRETINELYDRAEHYVNIEPCVSETCAKGAYGGDASSSGACGSGAYASTASSFDAERSRVDLLLSTLQNREYRSSLVVQEREDAIRDATERAREAAEKAAAAAAAAAAAQQPRKSPVYVAPMSQKLAAKGFAENTGVNCEKASSLFSSVPSLTGTNYAHGKTAPVAPRNEVAGKPSFDAAQTPTSFQNGESVTNSSSFTLPKMSANIQSTAKPSFQASAIQASTKSSDLVSAAKTGLATRDADVRKFELAVEHLDEMPFESLEERRLKHYTTGIEQLSWQVHSEPRILSRVDKSSAMHAATASAKEFASPGGASSIASLGLESTSKPTPIGCDFGAPTTTAPASSTFGAPSAVSFGGQTASSTFGAPSAATASSTSGAPLSSVAPAAPSFGAPSAPAPSAVSSAPFGAAPFTPFGEATSVASSFGATSTPVPSAAASLGSAPLTPFGAAAPAASTFGAVPFGAPSTPAAPAGSNFGAPAAAPAGSTFAAPSAPFGAPSAAPAVAAFGTPQSALFGAQTSTAASGAFGSTSTSAFGASSSPFGGMSLNTAPKGSAAQTGALAPTGTANQIGSTTGGMSFSTFGSPTTPGHFGGAASSFGGGPTTPAFGQTSALGALCSASPTGFGQAPTSMGTPAFGKPTALGSAAFGQPTALGCGNAFGSLKTSSQSSFANTASSGGFGALASASGGFAAASVAGPAFGGISGQSSSIPRFGGHRG